MTLCLAGLLGTPLLADAAIARDIVLRWQDTVEIEHRDRRDRLRRLSDQALMGSPRFYESLIRRSDLPSAFGTDIPVLRVVFPQNVFFDTAAHELRPEARDVIAVVAQALRREASDTAVFIAGHTDARGGGEYNYDLSVRRAETVARALKGQGVRQADIWRIGFGKAVPLAPNDDVRGMARNRRVEFLFARKPEAVGLWLSRQQAVICANESPATRSLCLKDVASLPPIEAVPVLVEKPEMRPAITGSVERSPAGPPAIDMTGARPVVPDRSVATPPPAGRSAASPPIPGRSVAASPMEPVATATIARTDRVIVDMRQERIYVGRPER